MTLYLVVPLLILVAILQASAIPHFRIWGVFPDLPLLVVVSWSLLRGSRSGLVWGTVAGLSIDLLSGTPTGAVTLALAAVGSLAGLTRRSAFRGQLLLPIAATFVATVLYNLIVLLAMLLSGRRVEWLETLTQVVLPAGVLNLLLLPVVYFPLRGLHHRLARKEVDW